MLANDHKWLFLRRVLTLTYLMFCNANLRIFLNRPIWVTICYLKKVYFSIVI